MSANSSGLLADALMGTALSRELVDVELGQRADGIEEGDAQGHAKQRQIAAEQV